jgi:hypothetical protein
MTAESNDNVAVGYQAAYNLTTGSYNIDIGNKGVAADSGIIRVGTAGQQNATFSHQLALSAPDS